MGPDPTRPLDLPVQEMDDLTVLFLFLESQRGDLDCMLRHL